MAARTSLFSRDVETRTRACLKMLCARLISFRTLRPSWAVINASGTWRIEANDRIKYFDHASVVMSPARSHLLTTKMHGL